MQPVMMRTMIRANQQEQRTISNARSRGSRQSFQKWPLLFMMLVPVCVISFLIMFFGVYNSAVAEEKMALGAAGSLSQKSAAAAAGANEPVIDLDQVALKKTNLRLKKDETIAGVDQVQADQAIVGEDVEDSGQREILVLTTPLGDIRIVLRPDLSAGSVDYIHRIIDSGNCRRCRFHRAEQHGILQGVIAYLPDVELNKEFGTCPEEFANVKNNCPSHDKNCGCHGPVMTRGSVGWAAGSPGGPDFFIDAYKRPANWWGTQHTNFGFIEDSESMRVVDSMFDQPTKKSGGLQMLIEQIQFTMRLETEAEVQADIEIEEEILE